MRLSSSLIAAITFALALPVLVAAQGFDPELEDGPPSSAPSVTGTEPPVELELPKKEGPHEERGPADLKTYLSEGRTPSFIRINVRGQRICTNEDFFSGKKDNIDFETKGGELFNVRSVKAMDRGAAVEIDVSGQSRWVYVSHERKDAFQVCESEACMSSLADGLDFLLHGTGVAVGVAEGCGVSQGPEGLVLPPAAPSPLKEPPPPSRRPMATVASGDNSQNALSVKPLWEHARGAQGAHWTRLASNALDKLGQGLLRRSKLNDARRFCPKFSSLTPGQKKEFFIHLLNGIARYESNFKTGTPVFDEQRYRRGQRPYELYRGPIKPAAYSMGLFQLSYSAASGYQPQCRIDYNKDRGKDISDPSLTIYNPQIQMECAVTILNQWVSEDGGLGYSQIRDRRGETRYQGGAHYWSTLRNTNPASQAIIDSLKRFGPCWR